jgi:hypothetical protein
MVYCGLNFSYLHSFSYAPLVLFYFNSAYLALAGKANDFAPLGHICKFSIKGAILNSIAC